MRPFVYGWSAASDSDQDGYKESYTEARPYPVNTFFCRRPELQDFGIFETSTHLFGVAAPAKVTFFGTDAYGRDEFSRVLLRRPDFGRCRNHRDFHHTLGRNHPGSHRGYYGQWIDESLMGVTELFFRCPGFISCSGYAPSCLSI